MSAKDKLSEPLSDEASMAFFKKNSIELPAIKLALEALKHAGIIKDGDLDLYLNKLEDTFGSDLAQMIIQHHNDLVNLSHQHISSGAETPTIPLMPNPNPRQGDMTSGRDGNLHTKIIPGTE